MGIRVTAVDTETGETAEQVIEDGNYVIVTAGKCHVDHEQHYANGTTVLTLKDRDPRLMTTSWIEPTQPPDGA